MAHFKRVVIPESLIVKLIKVPTEVPLSEVIVALKGDVKTILSCYRIFNYSSQTIGDDVVIGIRDIFEYKELREKGKIFIRDQEIMLQFEVWQFGAAIRSLDNSSGPSYGPSPVSLKLSNLTTVSRVTSFYMIKLLNAFEYFAGQQLTGLSLLYDTYRDCIRPFCFVAFSDINLMMKFHLNPINIFDETLFAVASTHVPLLINELNFDLLKSVPLILTQQLCDANLLNLALLARSDSQMSLTAGIAAMNLLDSNMNGNENVNEKSINEITIYESDHESVLSIDISFDFDEDMEIIDKI